MGALCIIPARYASVRFPGKMLASQTGKPLVQHVWERARSARRLDRIVIATDDSRIADAARSFGAKCIMTRPDHPNGTSRIAEAVDLLSQSSAARISESDLIVNVQGDEPEMDPAMIDIAIDALAHPVHSDAVVSTVAAPFGPDEDPTNPNLVKVVVDARGRALYFSRSFIPFHRTGGRAMPPLKHLGLYVYRRSFLANYPALSPTPLENAEQLEQLRILEHGHSIALAIAPHPIAGAGIDTPEQYEAFVRRYSSR